MLAPPHSNAILDSFSPSVRALFGERLVAVPLPVHASLYENNSEPQFGYFMTSGVASVVGNTPEGHLAEVSIVGREGVTGSLHLLGSLPAATQCFVQVAGTALRYPFADLRRLFRDSAPVRDAVLSFVQKQSVVLEQISTCQLFHEAHSRLARWLLMIQDRTGSDEFSLTQEFLSEMLGSGRPTVTLACGALQRTGAILIRRGHITIVNREELKQQACSCYLVAERCFHAKPSGR
ncbi:Crp/Fnr family transcriptional regulator [Acidipila sp. EB88]|uniref:Crp/Fnr family transcriptional regulator n=1 Tax=Acidipila sp. EB88 TaxID=2305226 RepID=UPI001315925B|nr:Crp/Fnr family transcriptional regulator [Acidipila sp. EB88]